jgi:hypothetical protein
LAGLKYIADAVSLIDLVAGRAPTVKVQLLTRLVKDGRLRIPDAVKREVRRKDDRLKRWIDRQRVPCIIDSNNQNTAELSRIARLHQDVLGDDPRSADPVVVCMGLYYKEAGWVVLSNDAGVQAACAREMVHCLTVAAFRRLEV